MEFHDLEVLPPVKQQILLLPLADRTVLRNFFQKLRYQPTPEGCTLVKPEKDLFRVEVEGETTHDVDVSEGEAPHVRYEVFYQVRKRHNCVRIITVTDLNDARERDQRWLRRR